MEQVTSPVQNLIDRYESKTLLEFKPAPAFYQKTGLNPHRLGKLARGKKKPDSSEIRVLLDYFNQFFPVKAEDLL